MLFALHWFYDDYYFRLKVTCRPDACDCTAGEPGELPGFKGRAPRQSLRTMTIQEAAHGSPGETWTAPLNLELRGL
jgi:hypothetical protein